MRYAIVVSTRRNYAGLYVEHEVVRRPVGSTLAAVVLCRGELSEAARRRLRRRRLRKALRLGIVGTLNGVRMRRWYGQALAERFGAPDIGEACARGGVPLIEIPGFHDPAAQERVRSLELDLGVSMGNGYIPRAFFSIPRLGMINVHHEVLPRYRGAQTALWQIHDGSEVSGFSIHEISERVDAGRLLHVEQMPLAVRDTLRDTVVDTCAEVQLRSLDALRGVLDEFERYRAAAQPNVADTSYTTPGTGALARIYLNWLRLRRAAPSGP